MNITTEGNNQEVNILANSNTVADDTTTRWEHQRASSGNNVEFAADNNNGAILTIQLIVHPICYQVVVYALK